MKFTETNLGFFLETPDFIALMGGVKSQLVNLQASYEGFEFIRVKQTHSDIVVRSEDPALDYQIEADAHYSTRKKTALCVVTADCIPVLVYDPKTKFIAGIHAGWRGVANKIVPKTLAKLAAEGVALTDLQLFVGPHIQMDSFEVGTSVRDEILATVDHGAHTKESIYHRDISPGKSLVDLNEVLRAQLHIAGIEAGQIQDLNIDTFSDGRFHSHRRDKEKAGRQISFIALKR